MHHLDLRVVAAAHLQEAMVLHPNQTTTPLTLIATTTTTAPQQITAIHPDDTSKLYEAQDLFRAMQDLRLDLEQHHLQLLCAGARPDAAVSGMLGSSTGGRKAYLLRPGEHADPKNLIDIFSPATPAEVGTVQQQRDFLAQAVQSLAQR